MTAFSIDLGYYLPCIWRLAALYQKINYVGTYFVERDILVLVLYAMALYGNDLCTLHSFCSTTDLYQITVYCRYMQVQELYGEPIDSFRVGSFSSGRGPSTCM